MPNTSGQQILRLRRTSLYPRFTSIQPGNAAGRIPTQPKTLGDVTRFYNGGCEDDSRFGRFSLASRDIVIGLRETSVPGLQSSGSHPRNYRRGALAFAVFGRSCGGENCDELLEGAKCSRRIGLMRDV